MQSWIWSLDKMITMLKLAAYTYFACLLYGEFIGPEGVADIMNVEKVSEDGKEKVTLLISSQLVKTTIGLAVLEALSNLVSTFKLDSPTK